MKRWPAKMRVQISFNAPIMVSTLDQGAHELRRIANQLKIRNENDATVEADRVVRPSA